MSECKYRPLFGRVLIEREIASKHGSIVIPEHLQRRHSRAEGVIVAVGPTAEGVKVGDRVIFGKHAGTWLDSTYTEVKMQTERGLQSGLKDNGDGTLFLCQDEDLLAIIEEQAA